MTSPLITARELAGLLATPDPPVLLDVRWSLSAAGQQVDERSGPRAEHLAGHLPGARFVDLESELSGPHDPARGRHPLPDPDVFAAQVASWGVGPDDLVVTYDDSGGMSACRLWWMLRWIGHDHVRVLDGGLGAWRAAGGPLEAGPAVPRPAVVDAPPQLHGMPTVSADEVAAGAVGVLLDARSAERYRGESEPVDPIAGHIPGALSAPTAANLDADGHFADPDTLAARFSALGVAVGRPVAVYCGSGVTAAHEIFALEVAGFPGAALYAPSWSGWISDPSRPIGTSA
ncbi:MAG: sulfurtransferase [Ilumatobacteraceae bacterium]